MENLKIERTEGRLSPRYRVIIADMDKGKITMDARIYGLFGSVVREDEPSSRGYGVGYIGIAGNLSFRAHGLAIKMMAANLRDMRRNHRRMWLNAIRGKRGEKDE